MSDTPDKPQKPKGKRIKLGLFLPWDKDGRLFNPDKFMNKDGGTVEPEAQPPTDNSKILKFPDESQKEDDE